jgi:hypothetical protein
MLCHCRWAGRGVRGSLRRCSLWIVNQVLVHFWMRRTFRWVLAVLLCGGAVRGGIGASVTVWHGLSDLGVWMRRCAVFGPKCQVG